MASLLDMQRLLGGTPSAMYQPPVPGVDEETQKLIDQVIDKEKRKPQALLNLFNLFSSGNQTAEQIIKERKERAARRRMPVDQERLLSPFRAQPVDPLQGQDFRIGDFRNTFTTDDLLNPDMVKVPPKQQVLMSESKEKPVTSVVDADNNQQSNNADNTQNNVDLNNVKSERNQQLGLMLYALGGALKGDKNFVENTIQIQQMQESKKKKKAQKEAWEKALKNLEGEIDPRIMEVAKAVGGVKGASLITSGLKSDDPGRAIKQEELNVLRQLEFLKGNIEKLTAYERLIYDNFIKRDDAQSILEQLGIVGDTGLIVEKVEG